MRVLAFHAAVLPALCLLGAAFLVWRGVLTRPQSRA